MKKYLLLLATAIIAISFISCKEKPPVGPITPDDVILDKVEAGAAYYDQKHGTGSGFYSMILSNEKGQKLRLDCFGTVSSNAANAKMTTGTYTMSSMADHKVRTFIVAEKATDEFGTIYWDETGAANFITGGEIAIALPAGGKTKIEAKLKFGEKELTITFNNAIKFANKSEYPEHTKDVIKAENVWGRYMGKGYNAKATAGQFLFTLLESGDLENKNAHGLQLEGYIPFPENNNNAMLPEGTYTVVSEEEAKNQTPFTIIAGSIAVVDSGTGAKDAIGCIEYYTDVNGNFSFGWVITKGTVKVEKSGTNYKITANLKGMRADKGDVVSPKEEDIQFSYEGVMDVMQNYADPRSAIKEDKDFGTMSISGSIVNIGTADNDKASIWQYFIFGEGIYGTLNGTTINITGTGDVWVAYLIGPKSSSDLGIGNFPMGEYFYAEVDPSKNVCIPADPFITAFEGPQNGFYHLRYNSDKTVSPTGAMPGDGFFNTKMEGDIYKVDYQFSNRLGNIIKGKFEGNKNSIQYVGKKSTRSSELLVLDPSYTIKY